MYNFDEIVDRSNTHASKYESLEALFGRADLLPFWVADMEFRAPQFMIDGLTKRAEHGIFGYTKCTDDYYQAIVDWLKDRHGVTVAESNIEYGASVVFLLAMMVRLFTVPGDEIIIQSPVYYQFKKTIERNGRVVSDNRLIKNGEHYEMDFDDLAARAANPQCSMMFLCSPHNPVGRVWTKEELKRVVDICKANGVLLISDEIHFDLVYKPHKHYSLAYLNDPAIIVCTAPSKTFNIAGLHSAYCIIEDGAKMQKYRDALMALALNESNAFSREVTPLVYRKGGDYLDQMLAYLKQNIDYVGDYLAQQIPQIVPLETQGTYLMWLDCSALGLKRKELDDLFVNGAGLALDGGYWFGDNGDGFMRLNIACPRAMLTEALSRLAAAVRQLNLE